MSKTSNDQTKTDAAKLTTWIKGQDAQLREQAPQIGRYVDAIEALPVELRVRVILSLLIAPQLFNSLPRLD